MAPHLPKNTRAGYSQKTEKLKVCMVKGASLTDGLSPLGDALVRSDDGRLDVDGVVPHAPQLQGFVQGAHYIKRIVPL